MQSTYLREKGKKMVKNNTQDQNSFWNGLMLGSIVGSSVLYFFGTKKGREKLRNILDAVDDLDDVILEELDLGKEASMKKNKDEHEEVTSNIHAVLDKIQSSLPTRKEIQKYFVKDGKLLK